MNEQALTLAEPETALTVHTPRSQTTGLELAHNTNVPTTAAQAKVDAVAALTLSAYQKASTLELTPKEITALQAEFPDDAFQPGAAGKENLIYIQHAHLRDRLNQVFRPGQWSIVPRNRWAEDFKTQKGSPASRVYVEAMLVIRGCFVAEAVGEMEYYPNNASQNYGDAVEGAKTAALRRCCKELGIGLQAWKKEWCEGWWIRRNTKQSGGSGTAQATGNTAPRSGPTDKATASAPAVPRPCATEDQRRKLIGLWELEGKDAIHSAHGYFIDVGAILPTESLSDIPLRWVPVTTKEVRELGMHIASGRAIIPSWLTNDTASSRKPMTASEAHAQAHGEEVPFAEALDDLPLDDPPAPAYVIPDGMAEETGEIQHVTLKEGASKKGPWSLWGIKCNGVFHNTFDSKIGKAAHENKGKVVTVIYRETSKGRNVHDLYIDGKGVLA